MISLAIETAVHIVIKIGSICLFFASLFSCGYSFAPQGEYIDKRIQKVYVESFDNKTAQAEIENYVRTAFINQFIQFSRLKVVGSTESADAIIKGTILNLNTTASFLSRQYSGRGRAGDNYFRIEFSGKRKRQNYLEFEKYNRHG